MLAEAMGARQTWACHGTLSRSADRRDERPVVELARPRLALQAAGCRIAVLGVLESPNPKRKSTVHGSLFWQIESGD